MSTNLSDRYRRIRMAVFRPEYLDAHIEFTEEDFTRLIDEIIRLQEIAHGIGQDPEE